MDGGSAGGRLTWLSPSAGRTTSLYRCSALLTIPTTRPSFRSHLRKRCASGNTAYGAEEPNVE